MASATFNPTAVDAAHDQWTLSAGGTKVAAVLPPDDSLTSYIQSSIKNDTQLFTFNFSAIPVGSYISSVTVTVNATRQAFGNGTISAQTSDGTNNLNSATITTTAAFVTTSRSFPTQADGLTPWTRAALLAHTFGVKDEDNTQRSRVTTITVTVEYVPPVRLPTLPSLPSLPSLRSSHRL
jgi:hypothetical protein